MSYNCVMCGNDRGALPYTCRPCWASLGTERQAKFYKIAENEKGVNRGLRWLATISLKEQENAN